MSNNESPWFPMILSEQCDGCAKTGKPRCVEFCPNGVFTIEDGKAMVSYPAKCGGGCCPSHCSACAPLCHKKTIVFPKANVSYVHIREEDKGLIRKTTCKVCGKKYWTDRELDICFDCEKTAKQQ